MGRDIQRWIGLNMEMNKYKYVRWQKEIPVAKYGYVDGVVTKLLEQK